MTTMRRHNDWLSPSAATSLRHIIVWGVRGAHPRELAGPSRTFAERAARISILDWNIMRFVWLLLCICYCGDFGECEQQFLRWRDIYINIYIWIRWQRVTATRVIGRRFSMILFYVTNKCEFHDEEYVGKPGDFEWIPEFNLNLNDTRFGW